MPSFHPAPQVAKQLQGSLAFRALTELPAQVEQQIDLLTRHQRTRLTEQFVDDPQGAPPAAGGDSAVGNQRGGGRSGGEDVHFQRRSLGDLQGLR